jgi:hypothetical protein
MDVEVRRVQVTPSLAASMFNRSEAAAKLHGFEADQLNRPIRNSGVERYARLMRDGHWDENSPAPVSVTPEGYVIDGQHRLLAVIESGVSVLMFIATEVPRPTQRVIDDGIRRKASDFSTLTTKTAAITNNMVIGKRGALSNIEIVEFYEKHRDAVNFAAQSVGAKHVRNVTVAPVLAAIARAWYTESHPRLLEFAEVLKTGMTRYPYDDAAVTLRNYLLSGSRARRTGNAMTYDVYQKTEYCLRAFLDRRSGVRKALAETEEQFDIPK